ncbi:MAG: PKD domain-containing protein, partial [Bacteroidota bacterium]
EVCPNEDISLVSVNNNAAATVVRHEWSVSGEAPLPVFSDQLSASTTLSFGENQSTESVYTITLEQESSDGCIVFTRQAITHQPRPMLDFDFANDNCSGDVVPTELTTTGADTYLWEVVAGSGLMIDNPSDLNTRFSVDNTGSTALTFEVRLTASIATTGCAISATRTLVIAPQPNMVITGDTDPICNGAAINLSSAASQTNNGEDFDTIEWFINGTSVSTAVDLDQALTNNGTSDIFYEILLVGRNSNGCTDSTSVAITVHPDARAELVSLQSQACFPFLIDENIISLSDYPSANTSDYQWEVDSAGTILQTVTGEIPPSYEITEPDISITYRLTAFSRFGCADDIAEFTFNSFPGTVAEFNPSVVATCEDDLITFVNSSTNATMSTWDFGDGRTSSEVSPVRSFENTSFTEDVSYTVKLMTETSDGCQDSTELSVLIHPKPFASWSTNGVCAGQFLTVTNESLGKGDLAYEWTVDNPTGITFSDDTAREPTITFDDTQGGDRQFNVTLEVRSEDNCLETFTAPIVIASRPTALFEEVPLSCSNVTTTFRNLSENNSATAADSLFIWQFGDGTSDTLTTNSDVGHIYADTGRYTVRLTAITTAGCSDLFTSEVRIIDVPQPEISFVQVPESGCAPLTVTFSSDSSIIYNEGETYLWDFGNGDPVSSLPNPGPVTFQQEENGEVTYTVSLTITNLCGSRTVMQDILVRPVPTADFSFVPFIAGCDDVEITILNESRGLAETFIWDYGDGSPIDTLTGRDPMPYVYQNDGNTDTVYTATLVAINDCGRDTTSRDITIVPFNDNATINILANGDVFCVGEVLTVIAAGLGGEQGRLINWTFNGVPQESNDTITLSLDEPGIFDINLDVEVLACDGFIRDSRRIEVQEGPQIAFEVSALEVCAGDTLFVTNLSTSPNAGTRWVFEGGNPDQFTEQPQPIVYDLPGAYTVRMSLASSAGCLSEDSVRVDVLQVPTVNIVTESLYCEDLNYTFVAETDVAQSFRWEILEEGRNEVSDELEHLFSEPGEYTIRVTAYGNSDASGCQMTDTRVITVNPNPVPGFTLSAPDACVDSVIMITNQSAGGATYRWTLWNHDETQQIETIGETTDLISFPYQYSEAGNYIIRLEAISPAGCSSFSNQPWKVIDLRPAFEVDRTPFCRGEEIQLTNTGDYNDLELTTFLWDLNDSTISQDFTPQSISVTKNTNRSDQVLDIALFAREGSCEQVYEEEVVVRPYLGCEFMVPEAFFLRNEVSPTGVDDTWEIHFNPYDTAEIRRVSLKIYNENSRRLVYGFELKRAGGIGSPMTLQVGTSEAVRADERWYEKTFWDGKNFDGEGVAVGRYYYLLEVQCCSSEDSQLKKGSIQVLSE